jgi:hypothetical protein
MLLRGEALYPGHTIMYPGRQMHGVAWFLCAVAAT